MTGAIPRPFAYPCLACLTCLTGCVKSFNTRCSTENKGAGYDIRIIIRKTKYASRNQFRRWETQSKIFTKYGPEVRFTGHPTFEDQPVYERQVTPLEVVRAVWRMDSEPEGWPSLMWMGFLSTGKVKGVMNFLGLAKRKLEYGEAAGALNRGRWRPVASNGDEGLIFESQDTKERELVPWSKIRLSPLKVKRNKDGEGETLQLVGRSRKYEWKARGSPGG